LNKSTNAAKYTTYQTTVMKLCWLKVKLQFLPEFLHWYINDWAGSVELASVIGLGFKVEVSRKGAKKRKA